MTLIELLINPYLATVGQQHTDGLEAVETGLPGTGFLESIINYIETNFYPSPDTQTSNEIASVTSFAYNDYINNNLNGYSAEQNYFISLLLNGIFKVPVNSIPSFLADLNDQVNRSGMSTMEKVPVFMAIAVAITDYQYWLDILTTHGNWSTYLNSEYAVNYANLPYWVQAAAFGTLCCANKASTYGLIDPPPVIGVDMVSALTGSLTVVSAKVTLNILPRISSGSGMGGGCNCGG